MDNISVVKELQENWGWAITIGIIVLLTVTTVFTKGISGVLGKYLQDSILQKCFFRIRKVNLARHPIFSKYRLLINHRLKYLRCKCPLRRSIFSDLMTIRVENYEKILSEFVKREDINSLSVVEFQYATDELLLKIFASWENSAKLEGIPPAIIQRFIETTRDIQCSLVAFVQSISASSYSYEDNRSRTSAIFDMLSGLEEVILSKMEETMDALNGEISEAKYKGIRCHKCEKCQSKHKEQPK